MVEGILTRLGFTLTRVADGHLCCGSAGTYSILQPTLSGRLLDNKLASLQADAPELIATANIGCQLHMATAADVPVRHWIELVDECLGQAGTAPTGGMLPSATGPLPIARLSQHCPTTAATNAAGHPVAERPSAGR